MEGAESVEGVDAASTIGHPINFRSGPLAGRLIRTSVHVEQDALLGRKYAVRDRRPLEPPPVLRLRLYEVFNAGTSTQSELEIPAEHVDAGPFILTATLFFVHPPTREELANRVNRRNGDTRPIGRSWDAAVHPTIEPIFPLNAIPDTDPRCAHLDAEWRQTMATQNAYAATPSIDFSVRHTAHLPREPARLDREAPNTLMFGTSVVNCMKITASSGPEPALYFCLSDLSIRQEGYYALRYRVVNLSSWEVPNVPTGIFPFMAECISAPFAIYSSKEFPGLPPSTALTLHLNRWHVRVNMREQERRRRSPEAGAKRKPKSKKKAVDYGEDDEGDDDDGGDGGGGGGDDDGEYEDKDKGVPQSDGGSSPAPPPAKRPRKGKEPAKEPSRPARLKAKAKAKARAPPTGTSQPKRTRTRSRATVHDVPPPPPGLGFYQDQGLVIDPQLGDYAAVAQAGYLGMEMQHNDPHHALPLAELEAGLGWGEDDLDVFTRAYIQDNE